MIYFFLKKKVSSSHGCRNKTDAWKLHDQNSETQQDYRMYCLTHALYSLIHYCWMPGVINATEAFWWTSPASFFEVVKALITIWAQREWEPTYSSTQLATQLKCNAHTLLGGAYSIPLTQKKQKQNKKGKTPCAFCVLSFKIRDCGSKESTSYISLLWEVENCKTRAGTYFGN